jgi:hypothetical protein
VRWLADECVDAALVTRLRSAEHDASYIAEIASGVTDTKLSDGRRRRDGCS